MRRIQVGDVLGMRELVTIRSDRVQLPHPTDMVLYWLLGSSVQKMKSCEDPTLLGGDGSQRTMAKNAYFWNG